MCRGSQQNEREILRIRAFYTQLSVLCSKNKTSLALDYLTLHYLPRINGSLLEIDGSNCFPDAPPGFIQGKSFEIYVGDVKVLKGGFSKDEGENWKMDCKCALSTNDVVVEGMKDAEVSVAADGTAVMTEKVEMVAMPMRRRRRRSCELEEIPEEREGEFGSDACWCRDCGGEEQMVSEYCDMDEGEMEGVRWALDLGIWVVCFGVSYLVHRASSMKLRRKHF
ncbi:hypothetical protein OROMI_009433 [Orobanche minor]